MTSSAFDKTVTVFGLAFFVVYFIYMGLIMWTLRDK